MIITFEHLEILTLKLEEAGSNLRESLKDFYIERELNKVGFIDPAHLSMSDLVRLSRLLIRVGKGKL